MREEKKTLKELETAESFARKVEKEYISLLKERFCDGGKSINFRSAHAILGTAIANTTSEELKSQIKKLSKQKDSLGSRF